MKKTNKRIYNYYKLIITNHIYKLIKSINKYFECKHRNTCTINNRCLSQKELKNIYKTGFTPSDTKTYCIDCDNLLNK